MLITEMENARLAYEVSGTQSGPVLVFANSLGSNLHMWDKVLPAFEARYRVVRFDTRGHGNSHATHDSFTIEQLGSDVIHLLDQVQAGQASVCGLSLGGLVALWLGIHAPGRIDRLILANTAARIGSRDQWQQRIATVENEGLSSIASATVERWFTPAYRAQHPDEMERIRQMVASTDPAGYAACCAVLRDTDLRGKVESIRAASLIITGTHDVATPPADGMAIHAAIRNSKYVELNASHLSAWECAQEFTGAVLEHLTPGQESHG